VEEGGREEMTSDYIAELKKKPYPLYVAPKPYSFELNEDMIKLLNDEFNADKVSDEFSKAIEGKSKNEIKKVGEQFFTEMGKKWMQKVIQLGEEYSDRTIEVVLETVDRQGNQYLIFPHVYQRFIEIAYLSTQDFLKVPITFNNSFEVAYRIPKCTLYGKIVEKLGEETAKLMTCKNYCMKALEILQKHGDIDILVSMPAETAKNSFCEFSLKRM
jgi:hypothetical protein